LFTRPVGLIDSEAHDQSTCLFHPFRNDVLPAGYRSHFDNVATWTPDKRKIDILVNEEEPIVS
jgi:hypothetical protein